MAGSKDKSFLILRGTTWLVSVKVPAHLRSIVGKAHIRQTTGTDSLARANAIKHGIIQALKSGLTEAQRVRQEQSGGARRSRIQEAMEWRHDLLRAQEAERQDHFEDALDITTSLLADRAEEIAERDGMAQAKEFHAIATGKATPISTLVDSWLAERPMKPRQTTDYRRAVSKFTEWLSAGNHPAGIEQVSRRLAGQYVTEAFTVSGTNARTANKDISCLSSLWKWASRKGIATENIWSGQSLPKPKTTKAEEPREFTDEEIIDLFSGKVVVTVENRKPKLVKPSLLLRDFMAVAALSGMRVEEIARMTVKDIKTIPATDGTDEKPLIYFDIIRAKTDAGVRQVPVHPSLDDIITRRTSKRKPMDSLWPELPEPKPGSPIEKSQKVVKEFVTYRRRIGVDDRAEGQRQSRVTFHSWRRTFVTKAEQAGQPPHLISFAVGHERPGMTLGVYSGGPLLAQLKAVVESVKLPSRATIAS